MIFFSIPQAMDIFKKKGIFFLKKRFYLFL